MEKRLCTSQQNVRLAEATPPRRSTTDALKCLGRRRVGPAKAALESCTRYLARELGPENIRINSLSPGAIRTLSSAGIKDISEMIRVAGEHSAMKRTATQAEVANTAAFLLSDAASGITGQLIYVDCGYSIMAN